MEMRKLSILAAIVLLIGFLQTGFSAPSGFEIIKNRVVESLMKPEVDDIEIKNLLDTQKPDGTWPGINYADVSNEGFEHRFHLSNMVDLGRAYQSKTSKFYKSKSVKTAIELALKNWVENDYICENWWYNQIGTPDNLVTLMLLTGDELSSELVQKAQPIIGRAHIDAPGARPGGDRIKIAGIQAKNLLFLGDKEAFNKVIRVIESEIKFSEWVGAIYGYGFRFIPSGFANRDMGGRGIQYDYSFHHRVDGVNNTLSYGTSYASAFIEWAAYVGGTEYAFADEPIKRLVDYYLDGICKHLVFGKYPDPGAKNRSISREGALKPYGSGDIDKLLNVTNYRKNELVEIKNTRDNNAKSTLSHATFYWNTEHFTVQRPGWFTSVRMYSTRNYNMEVGYNSEGLKNHHRGDGANHISRTGDEYYDIAPVFDYQKVPGATIMQKENMPAPGEIQKLGLTSFVGAVTDGTYGTAAFDFRSPHDPLIARKSWFFFDDEYVCLGAGISCRENLPVATALNQCLLRGDVIVSSANNKSLEPQGEKELQNVDWVFHDGIGYVFPEPVTVGLKNNTATGSWWDINKQSDSPKDEVKLDVFKLWLNHGERPSDAKYQYIVVPATSAEKLEQNFSKANIEIISNTPEIQAVKNKDLNIVQAVFYKAGHIQISDNVILVSDNPGIIMLKMENEKVTEISVSDPNRELGKFYFSLSTEIKKQGENFSVFWNEMENASFVSIDLPQGNYAGSSVTIEL
jgi:chondroitin AC lyase